MKYWSQFKGHIKVMESAHATSTMKELRVSIRNVQLSRHTCALGMDTVTRTAACAIVMRIILAMIVHKAMAFKWTLNHTGEYKYYTCMTTSVDPDCMHDIPDSYPITFILRIYKCNV